jgi:uncharacterized membrane protein (UPF0127 family)
MTDEIRHPRGLGGASGDDRGQPSAPEPDGDPPETAPARPADVAVGISNAFRPWLWGLLIAGGFTVVLLVGANRPANPTFVDAQSQSGGVAFPEKKLLVGTSCLRVQVADTPERRAQGLKNRDKLAPYDGMVFEFDHPVQMAYFTMSEVRFPLTIGFYDPTGLRVDAQDMEPCTGSNATCPRYGSRAPFKTALEVAKGKLPDGPLAPCPA